MTETELEAKLQNVNEQFLQFQRQQKSVRKHYCSIGLISLGFALAFAVVCLVFSTLSLLGGTPNPTTPFALTTIPLFFLSIALLGGGSIPSARRRIVATSDSVDDRAAVGGSIHEERPY